MNSPRRRGVALIEAMTVVLILAIAIPPSVAMLMDAAGDRADAVNISRATTLCTAILETVAADAASTQPGLGPTAFDDLSTYLGDPGTGLTDRLAGVTDHYAPLGFTWSLDSDTLSGLSAGDIATLGGADAVDRLRLITVTVSAPAARGGTLDIDASLIVGDTTP